MQISAQERKDVGTSASRRLRRANQVPGIVYGGEAAPIQVALDHNTLYHALRVEAFHSSILDMDIDGKKQRVLLRNVQWHPYKQQVLHVDFQRVAANQKITVKVPLHFINGENSPAVKQTKAVVNHVMTEIEVQVLPKDLPEFIEVDLAELAIIDKRRQKANVSEVMNIIGEVSGRSCLLMDDMVDTAGTLCRAAEALKKHGAVRVSAYCTHPVLSGKAIERITESPLDELVVTDTIPLTDEGRACGKIRVLGCGQLIGETILRINRSDSVSMLFME